jgi:hypothetical protein
MAGVSRVSPYIGTRPTELTTISVIQAERGTVGNQAAVGLRRSLGLIY